MPVTFIWPGLLWGLLLVPAVLALYVRLLRRALAPAGVGVARPVVPLPVPADRSAIILAIDSSGSMRSQDILPTRLDAAKAAAKDFVAALPNRVRLGLVMFGGYALLLVPPGTDRPRILEAVDGLGFVRRTAIGEGLLEAVVALPERSRPGLDGTLPPPSGPPPPGPAAPRLRHPPPRRPQQPRHRSTGGRGDRPPPGGDGLHHRRGAAVHAGQRLYALRVPLLIYAVGNRGGRAE